MENINTKHCHRQVISNQKKLFGSFFFIVFSYRFHSSAYFHFMCVLFFKFWFGNGVPNCSYSLSSQKQFHEIHVFNVLFEFVTSQNSCQYELILFFYQLWLLNLYLSSIQNDHKSRSSTDFVWFFLNHYLLHIVYFERFSGDTLIMIDINPMNWFLFRYLNSICKK